jgi:phosphinothricin acetyltransferase
MNVTFENLMPEHREAVIDIFNYFIENSFAAFPEQKVGYSFFDKFLGMTENYPFIIIREPGGKIIGFAFLRAYNFFSVFDRTADITYFILPEYSGKGIGTLVLLHLEKEAKKMNIQTFLAEISSLNGLSIRFHEKNGFTECGRFKKIGKKLGKEFDVIWMQKDLS